MLYAIIAASIASCPAAQIDYSKVRMGDTPSLKVQLAALSARNKCRKEGRMGGRINADENRTIIKGLEQQLRDPSRPF